MENKELQQLVEEHYQSLFDKACKVFNSDIYDVVVRVEMRDGLTIEKSWLKFEDRIKD